MTVSNPLAPCFSPDAWRERLNASRRAETPTENSDRCIPLWRQFQSITARTRTLLRNPLEFAILRQMADRALQLSQLAFDELTAAAEGSRPVADPLVVAALLDENAELLAAIGRQQRLIHRVHADAEPLQQWTIAALKGNSTGARWQLWAEEWLSAACDEQDAAVWPAAGVALDESLSRAGRPAALWTVHALGTARLAAAVGPRLLQHDPFGPRHLVVAGLLQNLALWDANAAEPARQLLNVAMEQHPATGAAVLATDSKCPAAVTLLVGLHEERIDGSGGPQKLVGENLPRRAIWLGLLSRFSELVHRRDCHAEAVSQSASMSEIAGAHLWREARRGIFPETFVRDFLDALEPGLAQRVAEQTDAAAQLFVDRQHQLPQPHAEAQPAVQESPSVAAPLFLRRHNGAVRLASVTPTVGADTGGVR